MRSTSRPSRSSPPQAPDGLLNALGVVPAYVGRNQFDYLVELDSEDKLRTLRPNFSKLAELPVRGVIVTSRSAEYDFVCRFFAPGSGIQEDPVTGSAYCCLGPYWAPKLNKASFWPTRRPPGAESYGSASRGTG